MSSSKIHQADEAAAEGRRRQEGGYVVSSDAAATRRRQAFAEPPLSARPARPGRPDEALRRRDGREAFRGRFRRNSAFPRPWTACCSGRRNNPPEAEKGIRSLAVYNPIHYQELPELFMDFICSLTGKSPSTTGAGSEGALTKGPFNAAFADHRSEQRAGELHSHGTGRFFHRGRPYRAERAGRSRPQPAGPEIFCRLTPDERNPAWLIREGLLEPVEGFQAQWRIDSGQPAGLSDHEPVCRHVLRPRVRQSVEGLR